MSKQTERLYDEEEIGAILKRTAELSKGQRPENRDGLSLGELKELAVEAGLNPDHVARAAVELSGSRPLKVQSDIFGGPLNFSTEIDLRVNVSQDAWEKMLPVIRTTFDNSGVVQERKDIREWTGSGRSRCQVSLHDGPQGSRLSVFWSDTVMAVPMFIPTILSAILSLPILFEELGFGLEGIPVYILIVSFFFMLSRFAVSAVKKNQSAKFEQLGRDLSRIALESEHEVRSPVHEQGATETTAVDPPKNPVEIPTDEFGTEESGDEHQIGERSRPSNS